MKEYINHALCLGAMTFSTLFTGQFELQAGNSSDSSSSSSSSSSDSCSYINPFVSSAQQNWSGFSKNHEGWRFAKNSSIKSHNINDLQHLYAYPTIDDVAIADSPAVVDGKAYFADFNGYVYAFMLHNGETLWQTLISPAGTYRAPIVGKNLLYVSTFDGGVFALDRHNGEIVWSEYILGSDEAPNPYIFAPLTLIECENIIISISTPSRLAAESAGRVQARNATTGEFLWEYNTTGNSIPNQPNSGTAGGGMWGAPAVVNTETGVLFVGTGDSYRISGQVVAPDTNSVLALNYRTDNRQGELLWYTTVSQGGYDAVGGPIIAKIKDDNGKHRDIVVLGTKQGYVYAVDQKDGHILWKIVISNPGISPEQGIIQAPCTDGEVLYVSSMYDVVPGSPQSNQSLNKASAIVAVRLSDGGILWRKDYLGSTLNAVTCSKDFVYFAMYYGSDDAYPLAPSNLLHLLPFPLGGILRVLDKNSGDLVYQYVNKEGDTPETRSSICGVTLYKDYLLWGFGDSTPGGVHVFKLK